MNSYVASQARSKDEGIVDGMTKRFAWLVLLAACRTAHPVARAPAHDLVSEAHPAAPHASRCWPHGRGVEPPQRGAPDRCSYPLTVDSDTVERELRATFPPTATGQLHLEFACDATAQSPTALSLEYASRLGNDAIVFVHHAHIDEGSVLVRTSLYSDRVVHERAPLSSELERHLLGHARALLLARPRWRTTSSSVRARWPHSREELALAVSLHDHDGATLERRWIGAPVYSPEADELPLRMAVDALAAASLKWDKAPIEAEDRAQFSRRFAAHVRDDLPWWFERRLALAALYLGDQDAVSSLLVGLARNTGELRVDALRHAPALRAIARLTGWDSLDTLNSNEEETLSEDPELQRRVERSARDVLDECR